MMMIQDRVSPQPLDCSGSPGIGVTPELYLHSFGGMHGIRQSYSGSIYDDIIYINIRRYDVACIVYPRTVRDRLHGSNIS